MRLSSDILDLEGKVVVDADLHKLCEKIERLAESMNQIVAKNKNLAEGAQYSLRNNVEISDITDSIPDKDLENTVKSICKDSRVKIQRILRAVTDSHSQEIAEGKIK